MSAATMEDWFAVNGLFVRYASSLDRGDVAAVVDWCHYDSDLRRVNEQWRFVRRDLAMDRPFGECDL